MHQLLAGATSQLIDIFAQDSSQTDGRGLTGLVYNSSNLICYYKRQGQSSWTAVTLADMTQGTWTSGGFKEGDSTHAKGVYEFGIPDAAIASSAGVYWVDIVFQGATNLAPVVLRILLIGIANTPPVVGTGTNNFKSDSSANVTVGGTASGAITSSSFGSGAINAAAIASDAITNAKIAADAIGSSELADGAITANKIASDAITAAKIAANAIDADALATDAVNEIASGLLDTVNTGATHNVNNSVGKQIRVAAGNVPLTLRSGTAQTGSTSNTIKLDSGASSINNVYVGAIVEITDGTGAGQVRTIVGYNGTTKVATVNANWVTTPDNTSTFAILGASKSIVSREGTAQAGASGTITLDSGASSVDHFYENSFVTIMSGTGSGQTRIITGYVGSTKVATVDANWSTPPDSTSVFAVIPSGNYASDTIAVPSPSEIAAGLMQYVPTARDLSAVTAPTVQDALCSALAQGAGDWTLTGTTLTLKNLDGSTFRVFTLDDATDPTSRT